MAKGLSAEDVAGIMLEDQKRIEKIISEMKVKASTRIRKTPEENKNDPPDRKKDISDAL